MQPNRDQNNFNASFSQNSNTNYPISKVRESTVIKNVEQLKVVEKKPSKKKLIIDEVKSEIKKLLRPMKQDERE